MQVGRLHREYKRYVSPYLRTACPYQPSCSSYARQALERHGLVRGGRLAFMRLVGCSGPGAGGHDPVPGSGVQAVPPGSQGPSPVLRPGTVAEVTTPGRVQPGRLARTAGQVGGLAAALSLAPLGLAAGAIFGAVTGFRVGSDRIDAYNAGIYQRHGEHKLRRLMVMQNRVAGPALKVHDRLAPVLGSTVSGVVGAALGLALGAAGGTRLLAGIGYGFGRYYAANRLHEHLTGELPARW